MSSILLRCTNGCTLVVIDQSNIFIELHESQPGKKFQHDLVFQIFYHSEFLEISWVIDDLLLDFDELVVMVVVDFQRHLIGVIVQVYEAVVQQEPAVTFLTIAVIDLLSSPDVFHGFNNEPSLLVGVAPSSLPGSLVIEHVCIGNKTICLDPLDLNTEDSTGDHHPDLRVLLDWKLSILWHFLADEVIILLDVFYLLMNLI